MPHAGAKDRVGVDPLVRGFVAVDEQCLVEQEAPRLGRLHYKRPVGGWLLNHRPEELPNSYRVILRYEGERGPLPPDVQRLDLDLYRPLVPVRLDTVHHIAQRLGKIEQHISGYIARQRSEEFRVWVDEEQTAEQASAESRTAEKGRAS